MQTQYLGVLALIGLAALIAAGLSGVSWLLGPKKVMSFKQSPYECGVGPIGDANERFPIKFYLIAILFILFDIEIVFLWSWMTVFKTSDREFMLFSFFEFLGYMVTWIVGYLYAIRVGAINWDDAITQAPEELPSIVETGDVAAVA